MTEFNPMNQRLYSPLMQGRHLGSPYAATSQLSFNFSPPQTFISKEQLDPSLVLQQVQNKKQALPLSGSYVLQSQPVPQFQTIQPVIQQVQQPVQVLQQPVQVVQQQPVQHPPVSNVVPQQQSLKTIVKTEFVENTDKINQFVQEIDLLKSLIQDKNELIDQQNKQIEYLEQKIFSFIQQQTIQGDQSVEIEKFQQMHQNLTKDVLDLQEKNVELQNHVNEMSLKITEIENQKSELLGQINDQQQQLADHRECIKQQEIRNASLELQNQQLADMLKDKEDVESKQYEEIADLKGQMEEVLEHTEKQKKKSKDSEETNKLLMHKIKEQEEKEKELLDKINNLEQQIVQMEFSEPLNNPYYSKQKEDLERLLNEIAKKEEMISEISKTIQDYEERVYILSRTIQAQEEKNEDQENQLSQYKLQYVEFTKLQGVIQQNLQQFVLMFTEIEALRERVRVLQEEANTAKRENLRFSLHRAVQGQQQQKGYQSQQSQQQMDLDDDDILRSKTSEINDF